MSMTDEELTAILTAMSAPSGFRQGGDYLAVQPVEGSEVYYGSYSPGHESDVATGLWPEWRRLAEEILGVRRETVQGLVAEVQRLRAAPAEREEDAIAAERRRCAEIARTPPLICFGPDIVSKVSDPDVLDAILEVVCDFIAAAIEQKESAAAESVEAQAERTSLEPQHFVFEQWAGRWFINGKSHWPVYLQLYIARRAAFDLLVSVASQLSHPEEERVSLGFAGDMKPLEE